jgi:hypothetical protein
MKKAIIYILTSMLLYSFFYELDATKATLILLGLAAVFAMSLVPLKFVIGAKYPIILLSFAGTAGFFFYPQLAVSYPVGPLIIFLALYSVAFYLITMDQKGHDIYKEMAGVSILFLSVSFNLAMCGKPVLIIPLGLSIMFFLFVLGRHKIVLLMAAYTLAITAVLVYKNIPILSAGLPLREVNSYILSATSFVFLVMSFFGFVKQGGQTKILTFFGFLYVCIDLLLSTGLKMTGGLLYHPIIALFMISPLIGLMLKKSEVKRA